MIGDIYKETPISSFQPSKAVADLTAFTKKEYSVGYEILHKPWVELNDYSIIDRMNKDQRTFNAYVNEGSEDPADGWKWKGTRSMARNKIIAQHARLTASYLIPEISAQNDSDEEDQEMADIMHDIVEWMTIPSNSNYQSGFLMTAMGMLVNPVTYMGAEYNEVYQTVKELTAKGYTKKEILDEVMSGFQVKVYSADQVLIVNAFQQNIQKQRSIIKRNYIDYTEAEAQYGSHDNWQYVQKGVKSIYSEDDGLFYDVKDDELTDLVEETIHLNRRGDCEVVYINGIYMGDSDTEANPIKHRDNKGAPKYNVAPFGYQRINEHFFYFKSMANALGWDNNLIDAMYENTMNTETLMLNMPTVFSGVDDEVDTDIAFPGATIASKDPNFSAKPLLPHLNPASGYNAMNKIEQSMSEGSVTETDAGQLPDANQKAYSVAQAAQASKTLLQGVGRTLGISVVEFGGLMIDIACNHLTVPQIEELASGATKLKYKNFILNDKTVNGKKAKKTIKLDDNLASYDMSQEQKDEKALKLAEEVGYPDNEEHIYLVNPELLARMKYLVRVDPERMFPRNQEYQQAMMNSLYTLLRQDPLIEPEALVRKLTYAYFRGEGEELIAKNGGIVSQVMGGGNPAQPVDGSTPSSPAGNISNAKSLSTALAGNVGG